jgi:hypothetical protein
MALLYTLYQIWQSFYFIFLIYYTLSLLVHNNFPKGVNNYIELCIYCIIWPFHLIKILVIQIKDLFQ